MNMEEVHLAYLQNGLIFTLVGYTPKLIMALKKRKALVMEFLSDTISTRFERSGYHFSLKTICMLALNMVNAKYDNLIF